MKIKSNIKAGADISPPVQVDDQRKNKGES